MTASPDIPDEAVEAALDAVGDYIDAHLAEPYNPRDEMETALAAAYPALTRQAVAAERERIATAIEAAKDGCVDRDRMTLDVAARIARAEPETT